MVMDDIDRAGHHNLEHEKHSLAAHANRPRPTGHSAEICQECEDPIPLERQQKAPGCTLCIVCQREQDRAVR